MKSPAQIIAANLDEIRSSISDALAASNRVNEHVELIAVTKYVDIELTNAIFEAGCQSLGESRPQDLWGKAESFRNAGLSPRWHMIGHLQRNKVKRTLPIIDWLHSGDSLRLLQSVNKEALAALAEGKMVEPVKVLLEINISGDESKHGFAPAEVPANWESLSALEGLKICGLMGMASREGGRETARQDFAKLRALRDLWQDDVPESISLDELSMGMSGDYDLAVLEGATMVRVGSKLTSGIEH